MRRAVFLDRDGTIIEDVGHLHRSKDIRLMSGAARAIRMLREAGYVIVVVTNQSVVARGMLTEAEVELINSDIDRVLAAEGAKVDAWYYCPHHPHGSIPQYSRRCECRKPAPGLLLRAANDMDIDLASSWMVGNSITDVEAGERAGVRPIKLGSDTGDLHRAATLILAASEQ